jgi:flagellar biosynthesis/type III secretory pathway protein FliH
MPERRRRMNLEEAIDILKNVIADEVIGTYCLEIQKEVECSKNCENEDCFLQQAIDTVLTALDERYNKGYQDGYNQGYLAGAMERI